MLDKFDVPDSYKGREQSYIKHQLFEAYLKRLFMIIGQNETVIQYVDCFSGPWNENTDDLSDTSIGISLKIMKECQKQLLKNFNKEVTFKALYIEIEVEPFKRLESILAKEHNHSCELSCINGDFYYLRNEILDWAGSRNFTFFFIDPKGWKKIIEISTLQPLLLRPKSEFLINFMYEFLIRGINQEIHYETAKDILGRNPNKSDTEEDIIESYCLELKKHAFVDKRKARATFARVLRSDKKKTFFYLVYLTRHPYGIVVFNEESEKTSMIQGNVRYLTKQEKEIKKTGQQVLDFMRDPIEDDQDKKYSINDVKNYWLKTLSKSSKQFDYDVLADILEETRWFISDLQEAFCELQEEGLVKNLDAPRFRPKHPIHFKKSECLVKL